jgi:hypothetical protein
MAAAFPYSCQTGEYTVEQLDGEDCAKCGRPFAPGQAAFEVKKIAEWTLVAHILCPKVGATR